MIHREQLDRRVHQQFPISENSVAMVRLVAVSLCLVTLQSVAAVRPPAVPGAVAPGRPDLRHSDTEPASTDSVGLVEVVAIDVRFSYRNDGFVDCRCSFARLDV